VQPPDPQQILKSVFGYDGFRPGQSEIVENCLAGNDVLAILPTGGGKSLCFQIPGLILPGTAIVVSPLIALMEDQVQALQKRGVRAALISSSLPTEQKNRLLTQLADEKLKFIYVSPERLQNSSFGKICQKIKIGLIVVDEAHCISQWGDSFRPEYRQIVNFINNLESRPRLIALTASATNRVEQDIASQLRLKLKILSVQSGGKKTKS
jgi:ATP-dependent DNA helicase RecQ